LRSGKIASTGLTAGLALLATAAVAIALSQGWVTAFESIWQLLVLAGILVVAFAMVLMPAGVVLDRSLSKLQASIESNVESPDFSPLLSGPRWLRPLMRAVTGTVARGLQREQDLKQRLRELEIMNRVSETERRQVEAVLHSLQDGVIVTSAYNEIVMANETAARVLGFTLDESMHRAIEQVIQDHRLCQLIRETRENSSFVDRRHVDHKVELHNDAKGAVQQERYYDVTMLCVENHKHEVGSVVTILHDLTREREISQMKSDFVSKASHELRTPLSSIRAYVEMLVDGEASDEDSRREFYRIIQSETDRLGRLIDNMLNISRIEAGIVQIEREPVDVKQLIDRAVATIEPQASAKNLSVHTKKSPVDLTVEGDSDMLYQVVLNLLSNAVKYTPDGGRVTISADSDNLTRTVLLSVADTGLGIPPDALPRLFDKFFRVENYKRVAKGTGLGLSLCKHIVETVHHGQIGVESKLGLGSKFWCTIPMRYAGMQAAA
jgi:two-component system phosphate regulon sensor histidine kinase PhoR